MTFNTKKRRPQYPSGMLGVYTSGILSMLSVVLAVLLLADKPWLLLYYLILSAFITAVVFTAKNYIISVRAAKQYKDNMVQTEEMKDGGTRWSMLIVTFFGLLLIIVIPMALARFLDPAFWIILIVSFTTGVSVAEVFLYLHLKGILAIKKRARNERSCSTLK